MRTGRWGPALVMGIIAVAAADQEYVIWRSTYASKEACDQAVAVRRGRVAKAVEFLRRIGADDTLLRVVGDRMYECRPSLTRPPSRPSGSEPAQSP